MQHFAGVLKHAFKPFSTRKHVTARLAGAT
jgi:hypothetical protein